LEEGGDPASTKVAVEIKGQLTTLQTTDNLGPTSGTKVCRLNLGSVKHKLSAGASVRNVISVHTNLLACNYILCQFISPYT
jgi:hypothetical protein